MRKLVGGGGRVKGVIKLTYRALILSFSLWRRDNAGKRQF